MITPKWMECITICIYNLFIVMLHITVAHYEKGNNQIQMCRKRNRLSERKVKISTRAWKSHQDSAMCIMIFQDTQDMGEVMEVQPPSSPVLLGFLQQSQATRQLHLHDSTQITHQKVLMWPRNSSTSLLVNSHMRSSLLWTQSISWIWAVLALTSASCPSRAGSPLKLWWINK